MPRVVGRIVKTHTAKKIPPAVNRPFVDLYQGMDLLFQ